MEATGGPPERPAAARPALRVEPRDRSIATVCAVLLLIGMPIGWLGGGGNSAGDVIGMLVAIAVSLALMFWLVTRFAPRMRRAEPSRATRFALILGALAVIVALVFWTGLPFALGAGAIALGLSLRESVAANLRGRATAAAVLGAIAVLASFLLLLFG